jgi:hypothetical protein
MNSCSHTWGRCDTNESCSTCQAKEATNHRRVAARSRSSGVQYAADADIALFFRMPNALALVVRMVWLPKLARSSFQHGGLATAPKLNFRISPPGRVSTARNHRASVPKLANTTRRRSRAFLSRMRPKSIRDCWSYLVAPVHTTDRIIWAGWTGKHILE